VPFTVKRDAWIFQRSEVVPLRGSVKQPKTQFAMYMGYTNTEVTSSVGAGGAAVGLQMKSQTWDGEVRGTDGKGQQVPLIYTEANQWTINLPKEIPDYGFATVTAAGTKQKEFNRNSRDFAGRTQEQLDNVIFPHLYRFDWMPEGESQTETGRSARVWYAWHTEDESDRESNAGRLDYFIGEYGPDTKEFWFDDYRKNTSDGPAGGQPFKFVVFGTPPVADDGVRTLTITETNAWPVIAYNVGPWKVIGYYRRLGNRAGGQTPKIGEATVVSDKDDFWKWFLTYTPILSDNTLKVTRARINAHFEAEPLPDLLRSQKRLMIALATEPEPTELPENASTQDWLKKKGEQVGRAAQDGAGALDSATRGVLPGGGKLGSEDAPATSSLAAKQRLAEKSAEIAQEIRARREAIEQHTNDARAALDAINKKISEGYDLYADAAHPYIAVWKRDYRKQYERIGLEIAIDTKDPGVIEKALEIARLEANSTDTRLLEAVLLKMKGDTIGALMASRSAVASDPDHAVAKKMLQDAECAFLIEAIDKSQGTIQQARAAFYGYLLERGFTNADVQVKGDWAFARGMSWAKSTARVYTEEAWAVFTTGLFGSFSVFTGKLEGEELLFETTQKQMVTAFVGLNTILRLRGKGYTFNAITNMTSLQVRDALPLRDYRGNLYPETNATMHCVGIREAMKLPDVQALIGVVPPEWVTKDRPAYTGDEFALRLGVEKGYWDPKDVGDTWIEYIGDATSMYNLLLLLGGAKVGMEGRTTSMFWSQADIAMMRSLEKSGHVISGTEAVANAIGLTHALGLMGQTAGGKGLVKMFAKLDRYQAGLGTFDTAVWTAGKLTGMLTITTMSVLATEHLVGHRAAMLVGAAMMFGSDFELLGKLLDSRNIPRAKVIELIINDYLPATQLHYKRLAQLNKNNLEIEQILARVKAGQKLSANDLAFLDTKIGHENWRAIIPNGQASRNASFAQGAAAEGIQNGIDNGAGAAARKLETTLVEEQAATVKVEQDAKTLVEGLKKSAPDRGPPPPVNPPKPRRNLQRATFVEMRAAQDLGGFPMPPRPRRGSQCAKAEALLHLKQYKKAQEKYEEIIEKIQKSELFIADEMPLEYIHLKRCLAYDLQGCTRKPVTLASKALNKPIPPEDVEKILGNPDLWRGNPKKGAMGNVYTIEGNDEYFVKSVVHKTEGEITDAAGKVTIGTVREIDVLADVEANLAHTELARALGFDVPSMEVRIVYNELGQAEKAFYVMRKIKGGQLAELGAGDIFLFKDELSRHRALAILMGDFDRKIDNYMVMGGRLVPIDAGLADITGARLKQAGFAADEAFAMDGQAGRDHWLSRFYKDELCGKDSHGNALGKNAPRIELWEPSEEFSRKGLVAEEALTYDAAKPTVDAIIDMLNPAKEEKLKKLLDRAFRKVYGNPGEVERLTKRALEARKAMKKSVDLTDATVKAEIEADVAKLINNKIEAKVTDSVEFLRTRSNKLDECMKGLNERNAIPLTGPVEPVGWLDDELTEKVVFLYILNHTPLRRAA